MRLIQWHLKNNWRPEFIKDDPIPRSLHPHLRWWLQGGNVIQGQPLHPLSHALQILADASKEGWGAHLGEHTARGTWSLPESKLRINYLELNVVLLALKVFQDLCLNQIVLIATDNTPVVSYNKEGRRHEMGAHCVPSVEDPDLVFQKTDYSQSLTHSRPAECGSRQAIQARPDHPHRVVSPSRGLLVDMHQVAPASDLFSTRFNKKLAQFVSPVQDPLAWVVEALSLSCEDLETYAFPPAAILSKVVAKLQDYRCRRIILIAPGWPNMPWFWDLLDRFPCACPVCPNS